MVKLSGLLINMGNDVQLFNVSNVHFVLNENDTYVQNTISQESGIE